MCCSRESLRFPMRVVQGGQSFRSCRAEAFGGRQTNDRFTVAAQTTVIWSAAETTVMRSPRTRCCGRQNRCNAQNDTRRLNPVSMHADKPTLYNFCLHASDPPPSLPPIAQGGVRGALRPSDRKNLQVESIRGRGRLGELRAGNPERKPPRSGTFRKDATSSWLRSGRQAYLRERQHAVRPATAAPAPHWALHRNNSSSESLLVVRYTARSTPTQ